MPDAEDFDFRREAVGVDHSVNPAVRKYRVTLIAFRLENGNPVSVPHTRLRLFYWDGREAQIETGDDGIWSEIMQISAPGPHHLRATLPIRSKDRTLVLFGVRRSKPYFLQALSAGSSFVTNFFRGCKGDDR